MSKNGFTYGLTATRNADCLRCIVSFGLDVSTEPEARILRAVPSVSSTYQLPRHWIPGATQLAPAILTETQTD